MSRRPPPTGAFGLFHPKEHDECPSVEIPVGGKLLKLRMEKGTPVKHVTPDEYAGDPPKASA